MAGKTWWRNRRDAGELHWIWERGLRNFAGCTTSEFELNFSSSRSCGAFRFETLLTMGVAVCGILMFGWRDGYI